MRRSLPLLFLLSACGGEETTPAEGDFGLPPLVWGGAPPDDVSEPPPKPEAPGNDNDDEEPPELVEPEAPELVDEADSGTTIEIVDAGASPPPADNGCGDLDFHGLCEGSVARWCDRDGRTPRRRDCGAQGCGWVDDETGYFCGGRGEGPDGVPDAPPPDSPPPGDPGDECGTPVEAAVIQLANQARGSSGLRQLACDAAGGRAARAHSQDMCDQGYFSHTGRDGSSPGDRLRRAGARFGGWAENIAWGQRDADAVHTTWMNSAGHRRNILGGGHGRIAVGLAVCGGRNYWTQVFMD